VREGEEQVTKARGAALVLALAAACGGRAQAPEDAGVAPPPPASAPAEPESAALPSAAADRAPPAGAAEEGALEDLARAGEAVRTRLQRFADDTRTAANQESLEGHFGITKPPFDVQTVPLAGEREGRLVLASGADRNPFVLVTDRDGALLWTKDRPLAGILPGNRELALTTAPEGGVALVWFDVPTRMVALRRWDWQGGILADFQLLAIGPCDAVSAMYWPRVGWLAAAAQLGAARLQRLAESSRLVWGSEGRSLPWASKPDQAVAMALDTDDSAILVQIGYAAGPGGKTTPGHVLAYRVDAEGDALWPRPIDLGPTPNLPRGARLAASRASPGVVRIASAQDGVKWSIDVAFDGTVRRRR
jgi:hypothetical protein